jgi:hypothetical protein
MSSNIITSQYQVQFIYCNIFRILILEQYVKQLTLFEISCWGYLLVSSPVTCTRAVFKMFSHALMTLISAVSKWGPYTSQIICHEARYEPIYFHTNLMDTPPNPTFMLSCCSSLILPLSLLPTTLVPGVTSCVVKSLSQTLSLSKLNSPILSLCKTSFKTYICSCSMSAQLVEGLTRITVISCYI